MRKSSKPGRKRRQNDVFIGQIRKKLGVSQAVFAAILGISRPLLALVELRKRELPLEAGSLVTKMYLQFMELEQGIQANDHAQATRLILNVRYNTKIPALKAREAACRQGVRRLSEELKVMKKAEKNAQHAMMVCTGLLQQIEEGGARDAASRRQIQGFKLLNKAADSRLSECWSPAQVSLQTKIESLRGEARVLRKTRLNIMKEHPTFKG